MDRVQSRIRPHCAYPHILGSPSSYMTLHPIPFEFSYLQYEENFDFFCISALVIFCTWAAGLLSDMRW